MKYNELLKKTENFAEKCYKKYKSDPTLWQNHIQLTRKYCIKLAKIEKANRKVLEIAALLHDIGKYKGKENHHITSCKISKDFLKNLKSPDLSEKNKDLILKCIFKHRTRFSKENNELEVRIIQSADVLGTLFDDEWQEHCRKTKTKKDILAKYKKAMNKINLESARKIAKPQIEKLNRLLK